MIVRYLVLFGCGFLTGMVVGVTLLAARYGQVSDGTWTTLLLLVVAVLIQSAIWLPYWLLPIDRKPHWTLPSRRKSTARGPII